MMKPILILLAFMLPIMGMGFYFMSHDDVHPTPVISSVVTDKVSLIEQIHEGHKRFHPNPEVDPAFGK